MSAVDTIAGRASAVGAGTPEVVSKPFLTYQQVAQLWHAGSVLVQEYGVSLNGHLMIFHDQLGDGDVSAAKRLVSDLLRELNLALKRWAPNSCAAFHWLSVWERSRSRGLVSNIAFYIPDELIWSAEEWLFERFLAKRFGFEGVAGAVRFRASRHGSMGWKMRRHLWLMRCLIRTTDPRLMVRIKGDLASFLTVLKLKKLAVENGTDPAVPQRIRVSETLGKSRLRMIKEERMAPLSAFGDGAWPHIATGWELDEYIDRVRTREHRQRSIQKINVEWPDTSGERCRQVREAALTKLRLTWPKDPKARLRTWEGWWLDGFQPPPA
jgi:hypothetical protein